MEKETKRKPAVRKPDEEFDPETFMEAMREVNNEVLQMEEIKSQTEKLKWDLICYLNKLLKEYEISVKIPAKSMPDNKGLLAVHFDGNGIVTYHFRNGSIKSFEMRTCPPSQLLKILQTAMPQLKTALRLRRREYEIVSSLISKISKHVLILQKEPGN